MKCLIISGGEFSKVKLTKYDLIIACDKGYLYAKKLKINPDIIIGDFDSATEPGSECCSHGSQQRSRESYERQCSPCCSHGSQQCSRESYERQCSLCCSRGSQQHRGEACEPAIIKVEPEKDDTDTSLAIKYALRSGYKKIDIICALGNRLDHTLANITMLKYITEHGAIGRILSDKVEIIALSKGKIKIAKKKNCYLSIFSLSDKSKINYIKGTKYDVKNIVMKNDFPLGISNEFKNKFAEVSVASGVVVVMVVDGLA